MYINGISILDGIMILRNANTAELEDMSEFLGILALMPYALTGLGIASLFYVVLWQLLRNSALKGINNHV